MDELETLVRNEICQHLDPFTSTPAMAVAIVRLMRDHEEAQKYIQPGSRGTGKTTAQMISAVPQSVFVWPHEANVIYAVDLSRYIGRTDLTIVHAGMDPRRYVNHDVILDHSLTEQGYIPNRRVDEWMALIAWNKQHKAGVKFPVVQNPNQITMDYDAFLTLIMNYWYKDAPPSKNAARRSLELHMAQMMPFKTSDSKPILQTPWDDRGWTPK